MSNRLDRFRKEMAAFEGAADPERSLERGHYVPHPRKSLADTIAGRIALRPTSTHLLVGGIGSGKTTELLVARDRINELDDISAHYVDVSLYADISQMNSGALLAVAGLALSKILPENIHQVNKTSNAINIIKRLSHNYKQWIPLDVYYEDFEQPGFKLVERKGVIPVPPETPSKIQQLIEAIDCVKQILTEKYGTIVLLLDGLDRLSDDEIFARLIPDVKILSSLGIGVVLIGPIQAAYGKYKNSIENTVDSFSYEPCFDVVRDSEAKDFFAKILTVRASEGFIEKSAAERLIHYSGGMLRDLINLTQSAIEEAYLSGSDRLQQAHVEIAAQSFGRGKLLGLFENELEIIERVAKEGKFIPKTEEDIRLLVEGRILEYRYPKIRHAVHPTIAPLIQKINV